jgi:hypothetical protein
MNSTFRLKSSIALLVLGIAMLVTPKEPSKSTFVTLSSSQPAIAITEIN